MIHPRIRLLLATLIVVALPAAASAKHFCPFCALESEPTLIKSYGEAAMVAYGYFTNPKIDSKNSIEGGTSDFVIEKVLKNHDILKGKTFITVPKYMPDMKEKKFILFCDVYKENVNPFRADEVLPGSELLAYLTSSLKFMDDDMPKRLRHCFDFLASPDLAISMDAYREFAKADYADYKDMAKKLPAKTICEWLKDPATPTYRYPLYASLLGHCGDPKEHGDFLRALLDDPLKSEITGLEGVMAGYVMLQPKEGWEYMQKLGKNDDPNRFNVRYAVVVTLRFFYDYRSDVLSKDQVKKGMAQLLDVPDVSDFAMDDLRNWQAWDMTDKILDLFKKPSHDNPIVDRAILRFALCSKTPRAAEFVAAQRKRDPVWVSDTEELLRADQPAIKTDPEPKKK